MKKTVFIKNAAVLTGCSIALRLIGIGFKVWSASLIGSEGMGLYSLVLSVYFFFSAFAASGIVTAVTMLCANNLSCGKDYRPILRKCVVLSLAIAIISSLGMVAFSKNLSRLIIKSPAAAPCLCVLAISLPAVGLSSVLKGWFFAVRKPYYCAASQITEQVIRISLSVILLLKFIKSGGIMPCLALVCADTVSEIFCTVFLYLKYLRVTKKLPQNLSKCRCSYKKILHIALPLTSGKYLSLFFRTAENILVPRTLSSGSSSIKEGLSLFGSIKAMALPVLLFPAGLLSSVSSLLIPEISSSLSQKRCLVVQSITEKIIKLTTVFALIFGCIFASVGREIGAVLFKSDSVGILITLLAPIAPLMYLDVVADGILKGLDCQRFSFFVGVADSVIRVTLIVFLLPRYGIKAFILIMYFSNVFTALVNVSMVIKKSGAETELIKTVFLPVCTAVISTKTATLLLKSVAVNNILYVISVSALSLVLYFGVLVAVGCITAEEIRDVIT